MADQYLQVAIFAVVAVLIPVSMLLFSRLIRPASDSNKVKTLAYESAEQPVGQKVEIMQEYMHYFIVFLSFEIIAIVAIIWSTFTRDAQALSGINVIFLLLLGIMFQFFVLKISRSKAE